jgi:hypothetical protein
MIHCFHSYQMLTRVTDHKLSCSEAISSMYSIFCTGVTMVTRKRLNFWHHWCKNIVTCYCEVSLATFRWCPLTKQCEYVGSSSIDDADVSTLSRNNALVQHCYMLNIGHGKRRFYLVTILLCTDFYWFVSWVRVGRLREKVPLKESHAGHVSCCSGRWRQSILGASKWQFSDRL